MKTILTILLLFPVLAFSQIVNIEEQRITGTNDSTAWYGYVRLGANISKVQDQILQLNSSAHVQYKSDPHLILLLLDGKFLRAGGQDFNNAGFAHMRYNYDITPPLVLEVFMQSQFNKLLLIARRDLAGAGLRYRAFKSKDGKNRIYVAAAYMYEHDFFTEENGSANWHRISSYLSFTLRPWSGVKWVTTTYFQPQIDGWSNLRLSLQSRLDLPLSKQLSFTTDFSFSLDHSLPNDAPREVYAWMNGLVWRLGR
ncbi:MAG: DUF481 domain-containing protein [Saprospiraceae bacterium]